MMDMWLGQFSPLGQIFSICAIVGGTLFVLNFILQLIGIVDDIPFPGSEHLPNAVSHIGDADVSFKVLSLQGLTAFFTMFGLVGLAMEQAAMSEGWSLLAALVGGVVSVSAIQKLFQLMCGLQSQGNIDLSNAIGNEGTVYLSILPGERGKVQIHIQGRLKEMDAVSECEDSIKTGERVHVVKIVESNVLLVARVVSSSKVSS